MDRKNFLKTMGYSSLALSTTSWGNNHWLQDYKENSYNVVFVLVDDLGWNRLGCYGSNYYETPNIDLLAEDGMQFSNAYACPVCSPTRGELMTGKYAARLHLTDYIPGEKSTPEDALNIPEWQKYLSLDEVTIAEALKSSGYKTASLGKWHLSKKKYPPKSLPYNPDKQGFDETKITYKPVDSYPIKPWQKDGTDPHNTWHITDWALDFIEQNQEQPFFLYLPYDTVHTPWKENEQLINKYRNKAHANYPANDATLAAMIETLDKNMGRLFSKIDELQLRKRTVVFFFSDNGGNGKTDQYPLRGGKGSLYEGGIRVPLIVRWPGVVSRGSCCDEIVGPIDFFRTILDITKTQRVSKKNIDGRSLVPLLTQNGEWDRDTYYYHYPHYHSKWKGKKRVNPMGAIRVNNYKLIEHFEPLLTNESGGLELYDLSKDIGERINLVHREEDKVKELRNKLKRWRKHVGAQMPTIKSSFQKKN